MYSRIYQIGLASEGSDVFNLLAAYLFILVELLEVLASDALVSVPMHTLQASAARDQSLRSDNSRDDGYLRRPFTRREASHTSFYRGVNETLLDKTLRIRIRGDE